MLLKEKNEIYYEFIILKVTQKSEIINYTFNKFLYCFGRK